MEMWTARTSCPVSEYSKKGKINLTVAEGKRSQFAFLARLVSDMIYSSRCLSLEIVSSFPHQL